MLTTVIQVIKFLYLLMLTASWIHCSVCFISVILEFMDNVCILLVSVIDVLKHEQFMGCQVYWPQLFSAVCRVLPNFLVRRILWRYLNAQFGSLVVLIYTIIVEWRWILNMYTYATWEQVVDSLSLLVTRLSFTYGEPRFVFSNKIEVLFS